jgi:hypothetical protein
VQEVSLPYVCTWVNRKIGWGKTHSDPSPGFFFETKIEEEMEKMANTNNKISMYLRKTYSSILNILD